MSIFSIQYTTNNGSRYCISMDNCFSKTVLKETELYDHSDTMLSLKMIKKYIHINIFFGGGGGGGGGIPISSQGDHQK